MNEENRAQPERRDDPDDSSGPSVKTNTSNMHKHVRLLRPPLTYLGHFGHSCVVGPVQKPGLVVVDVLDLHDELRLGLQRHVRPAVAGLCAENVLGLYLPVQPLDGVDVPRAVVDGEGGAGAFARQDVLNGAVALIHV